MAKLINGNGNRAIYATQDADLIASLAGNVTCIANVGNKYAATIEDANTIGLADGVIITKEGRRIQLDAGDVDLFAIPTGSGGVTNYYIIGYKLVQQADSSQVAETFVQKMSSSSATITEDTLRGGATEVYVSLYRVTQVEFSISAVDGLLPELLDINDLSTEIISTVTDFNTLTSKVKYNINVGGCPNSPTPDNGGQLFVADNNDGMIRQFFVSDTGQIFVRYYQGGTWHSWKEVYIQKKVINTPTDFNTLTEPAIYTIDATGSTNSPLSTSGGTLIVARDGDAYINQTFMADQGHVYSRYRDSGGTWHSWHDSASSLSINGTSGLPWKNAPDYAETTYFYEGADTTTLDLPNSNCFVTVRKTTSMRGIAIAYNWTDAGAGEWWINNLHTGSWHGWRKMPYMTVSGTTLNISL